MLLGVVEGVEEHVRDVLVGQCVDDLAASAFGGHESRATQHPQVLTDAWLRQARPLDELSDGLLTLGQPLDDGRAVPTYRAYSAGEPEACKQEQCADRVSFGAVLAKEFPNAGIDFSWTPEVSQQYVNDWNNASAMVQ